MIKFLQHVRGWTFSPDTVGGATGVIEDAWQSRKANKPDISAPHVTKPRARATWPM